ncbi:MAG TPA: SIS domain-containing protein [Nitrospirota bacterium]|nr:SIS domain-containing protein [Nitrospirota bacterium]
MTFTVLIDQYLEKLQRTIDALDRRQLNKLAELLMDAYQRDANIFICGNGGSALTASHFACDLNKGASYGLEKRWRVIALTDNLATIMAYANDVSYDEVFVEQLKNFMKPKDVIIAISGSGNSVNVLKAIKYAREKGGMTIGLTGYDGGSLAKIANLALNANINDMQISEDIHMITSHLIMSALKQTTPGSNK